MPSNIRLINLDNFSRVSYLGEGSYGEVWLVEDILSHKQYALKYFLKFEFRNEPKRLLLLEKEIIHLAAVSNSDYICGVHGIGEDQKYIFILQEYCGKSLTKMIKGASLDQKLQWIKDICMGVKYCHDLKLLHLDIKPENIVVSDKARLIDFGISQYLDHIDNSIVGTMDYLAPETADDTPYIGKETDIWALGVTIYEILYVKLPFEDPNSRAMRLYLANVENGKWNRQLVDSQMIPLFEGMFQLDAHKRWSIERVLAFFS